MDEGSSGARVRAGASVSVCARGKRAIIVAISVTAHNDSLVDRLSQHAWAYHCGPGPWCHENLRRKRLGPAACTRWWCVILTRGHTPRVTRNHTHARQNCSPNLAALPTPDGRRGRKARNHAQTTDAPRKHGRLTPVHTPVYPSQFRV